MKFRKHKSHSKVYNKKQEPSRWKGPLLTEPAGPEAPGHAPPAPGLPLQSLLLCIEIHFIHLQLQLQEAHWGVGQMRSKYLSIYWTKQNSAYWIGVVLAVQKGLAPRETGWRPD